MTPTRGVVDPTRTLDDRQAGFVAGNPEFRLIHEDPSEGVRIYALAPGAVKL